MVAAICPPEMTAKLRKLSEHVQAKQKHQNNTSKYINIT